MSPSVIAAVFPTLSAVKLAMPVTAIVAFASSVMSPLLVNVRKPLNTLLPMKFVPLSSVTVALTPFSVRLPKFVSFPA